MIKPTDSSTTAERHPSLCETPSDTLKSPLPGGVGRLMSLDALRGFDMFWIMGAGTLVHALKKVSDKGVIKAFSKQLSHVQWEGFHFYDLIFPMFVFISGVSMVFSIDKTLARQGKAKTIKKIVTRGILLVLLGIYFYGGLNGKWSNIRYLGVLQYIGLACFCGGVLYIVTRRAKVVAAVCLAILLGHWALMEFVPFPDVRLDKKSLAKTATQVGSQDPAKILASATGKVRGRYEEGYTLSNYVDYRFLPGRKINGAYENQPLLGVMGAIAAGLLGMLAGLWLQRTDVSDKRKAAGLLAAGVTCVAIGFLWGMRVPVVKKLWSPSFVVVAGGYSAVLLSLFYWVIDIKKKQRWCQPFIWIGMNALTLYLAHNFVSFSGLAARFAGGDLKLFIDAHVAKGAGSVLLVVIELTLVFLLARFLYKRRIFIKI
ncbi:MAG: heparan-alpha-glucosaminide N-acetyltransferase domain-containing protein [Kiritimatiellia bacterium]